MKNKKIIIAVIIVAVIITVGITVLVYDNSLKSNDKTVVNINMEELNNKFSTYSEFSDSKNTKIDKTIAVNTFGIDEAFIQEVIGKMPLINIKSSMFVIIKVTDGTQEIVKEKLETYVTNYEKQWSNYLEDQYNLVKNKEIGIVGKYVYLIISEHSSELKKIVK